AEFLPSEAPTQSVAGGPHWQERLHLQGQAGGRFAGFSPDSKTLVVIRGKGKLVILDTATWKERGTFDLEARYGDHFIAYANFSPDGRHLALVGGVPKTPGGAERRAETTVLDAANGKESFRVPGRSSRFAPDGKVIATVSHATIHLWDAGTGKETRQLAA